MFAMGALGRQEWRDEGLRSATDSEACIRELRRPRSYTHQGVHPRSARPHRPRPGRRLGAL
jgi:hypothetical protein